MHTSRSYGSLEKTEDDGHSNATTTIEQEMMSNRIVSLTYVRIDHLRFGRFQIDRRSKRAHTPTDGKGFHGQAEYTYGHWHADYAVERSRRFENVLPPRCLNSRML
jgi:hypothetical protein